VKGVNILNILNRKFV